MFINHPLFSVVSFIAIEMWVVVMIINTDDHLTDYGGVRIESIHGYSTQTRAWMAVIENLLDQNGDEVWPDVCLDDLMDVKLIKPYVETVPAKDLLPAYRRINTDLIWRDISKGTLIGQKIAEIIRDKLHKGVYVVYKYDYEVREIEEDSNHKRQKTEQSTEEKEEEEEDNNEVTHIIQFNTTSVELMPPPPPPQGEAHSSSDSSIVHRDVDAVIVVNGALGDPHV